MNTVGGQLDLSWLHAIKLFEAAVGKFDKLHWRHESYGFACQLRMLRDQNPSMSPRFFAMLENSVIRRHRRHASNVANAGKYETGNFKLLLMTTRGGKPDILEHLQPTSGDHAKSLKPMPAKMIIPGPS